MFMSYKAPIERIHWKRTFEIFLAVLPRENPNELGLLINYVSLTIFQYTEVCTVYESFKPNITRGQQLGENLQALKTLSKNCDFRTIANSKYCEEYIRDAFITGLPKITKNCLKTKL